jgi:RimJ/RimL family protein N-acetyltransferase
VVDSPEQAVRILQLDLAALRALAEGDLVEAQRHVPAPLTPYLVEPDSRHLWQMRVGQVVDDPDSAAWVTGIVVDERTGRVVGRAGFHGPPDDAGIVEVGYSIDTAERRRGYARAALRWMLARAAAEPDVRVVRASVSPDNAVSRRLVLGHGFVEVGDQWDDEDGLEIMYEVPAGGPTV